MIATRGSHNPRRTGLGLGEAIHVHETAPDFEGTCWCVVLVLDPHVASNTASQFGPGVLRRGRHHPVHQAGGAVELIERHSHRLLLDS